MRDKNIRRVFEFNPRYHRLDVELETEPRLDDAASMSKLKSKVQADGSLSTAINSIARCMVASMFYFELESTPERIDGRSVGVGHIQCSQRRNSLAFPLLLRQLANRSAAFYLGDCPIPGRIGDNSFLDANGNFRKRVELDVLDRFAISRKQGSSDMCNISGSPYSIERLVLAQGLEAHFGTANHRKRKATDSDETIVRKKARYT